MSYGFDNNGGVLKMTPSLLDRYMATARHVSRLAIGSPTIQPTAETFRLRADLSQDISFDSLPIGTRGGTAIKYQFPLDAEYSIEVEPLAGGTDAHQLEVSIDGERVQAVHRRRPPAARRRPAVAYDVPDDTLEVRVPVKAGPRVVGVTFVRKSGALVESVREPFFTPHAEGGTALAAVGRERDDCRVRSRRLASSETPSRQRIFACQPAIGRPKPDARGRSSRSSRAAPTVVRRPTPQLKELARASTPTGAPAAASRAASSSRCGGCSSARSSCSGSKPIPRASRRARCIAIGDLELASRLSFFLWSSIPDEALLDAAAKGALKNRAGTRARRCGACSRIRARRRSSKNFAGQWLLPADDRGLAAQRLSVPELRREPAPGLPARDRALLRQHRPREPQRARAADRRLHVRQRAARPALRHPERLRQPVPARHDRRREPPRPARPRQHPDGHLARRSHDRRRPRQVDSREPARRAAAAAAARRAAARREQERRGKVLSLRERMQQHRANPVCASCHARMDPLGFALENFDATGQWRDDGSGRADRCVGRSARRHAASRGRPACARCCSASPEQVATATTEKLLTYALGRGLGHYDAARGARRSSATPRRRLQVPVADPRRREQRAVQMRASSRCSDDGRRRVIDRRFPSTDPMNGSEEIDVDHQDGVAPADVPARHGRGSGAAACSMPWCPRSRRRRRTRADRAPSRASSTRRTARRWRLDAEGRGPVLDELSPSLCAARRRFKDQVLVPTGLSQRQAESWGDGNGEHSRGQTVWLSGVHPKRTEGADVRNATTVDQIAAQVIGKDTRAAVDRDGARAELPGRQLRQRLQLRLLEHDLVADADHAAADGSQPAHRLRAHVRRRRQPGAAAGAGAGGSQHPRFGEGSRGRPRAAARRRRPGQGRASTSIRCARSSGGSRSPSGRAANR